MSIICTLQCNNFVLSNFIITMLIYLCFIMHFNSSVASLLIAMHKKEVLIIYITVPMKFGCLEIKICTKQYQNRFTSEEWHARVIVGHVLYVMKHLKKEIMSHFVKRKLTVSIMPVNLMDQILQQQRGKLFTQNAIKNTVLWQTCTK